MKLFQLLILCLCSIFVYPQSNDTNNTNGTFLFQKATLTSFNYDTKSEVDTRVVNDPLLLDTTDMFFQNVFLEVTISNGILSSCILPNNLEYTVRDGNILIPAKESPSEKRSEEGNYTQLSPYSIRFHNNTLDFTFHYLYGDSRYNFPLEGRLVITLTKKE